MDLSHRSFTVAETSEEKYVTVLLFAHSYTCPVYSLGYSFSAVVKMGFQIEIVGRYLGKQKVLSSYSSLSC